MSDSILSLFIEVNINAIGQNSGCKKHLPVLSFLMRARLNILLHYRVNIYW